MRTRTIFFITVLLALQLVSPAWARLSQRALNFNLRGLNDAQYGSGKYDPMGRGGPDSKAPMQHDNFVSTSNATKKEPIANTVPQFLGSHSPQMFARNDNTRSCDPSKFEKGDKMEYADGGSKQGGPCCGGKGSQAGLQPYFFEEKPETDGTGSPMGKVFRKLDQKPKVGDLNSPAAYCAAQEAQDMMKDTPNEISLAERTKLDVARQQLQDDLKSEAHSNFKKGQSGSNGIAEGASEAIADAFDPTWLQMLELSSDTCLNVANESTGAACSANQPVKSYSNAIYLVQQAYKNVYVPIALLLLLPGAVMTMTKGLVSSGVLLNHNDDDAANPFTGILRSLVAIFLIPSTQLIVSYSIDVGNSLQYEVSRQIDYGNLFLYGDEQVFRAPLESFTGSILPSSAVQVLGKLAQGPEDQAKLFNQDPASVMLQMLANSMAQSSAMGLVILCAFQLVIVCYLLLMGPVAAAFYAWPGSTGSLFTRVFVNWVDAVINIALWRFWWCIVLLVMDTRLTWLGKALNMYSIWELIMFISFLVIMTSVPFNPFDFKAGDMIQQIMSKSEEAVQHAAKDKKGG
ncbi:MAG: hypothetical protein K2X93_19395 [Candidatus Obscuribacterales bacterium]|nr:hypothetical protein [Candidatus Obscuribacterales bacterium]